jgi:hypothetical protein
MVLARADVHTDVAVVVTVVVVIIVVVIFTIGIVDVLGATG